MSPCTGCNSFPLIGNNLYYYGYAGRVTRRRPSAPPEATLARAAQEWLARGRTQKLSAATETARRQDLVAIATRLAERLDRPAVGDVPPAYRLDAALGRLVPGALVGPGLLDAVADYASGHAPA